MKMGFLIGCQKQPAVETAPRKSSSSTESELKVSSLPSQKDGRVDEVIVDSLTDEARMLESTNATKHEMHRADRVST